MVARLKLFFGMNSARGLLIHYIIILITCYMISTVFATNLWTSYVVFCHSVLEIICIFIALCTFIIVWLTYDTSPFISQVIGFGFLAVAIFDIFHTYLWSGLNLFSPANFGVSVWHWTMGRFLEAIVFLLVALWMPRKKIPRWWGLLMSIVFSVGISIFLIFNSKLFPIPFVNKGTAPVKYQITCILIGLFVISAYKISKNTGKCDYISYKYILLALMIAVVAEICFASFKTATSFYNELGHILRCAYYYFIFKGIFVSSVTYPYKKLADTNKWYKDLLNKIPSGIAYYSSDYRLKFANSKAMEIAGCEFADIEGFTIKEMVSTFYKAEKHPIEDLINETQSNNSVRNLIKTGVNKQGKEINIRSDAHKLKNNDFLVLFDEAKKEQDLANLQLQTQTILNCISNSVMVVDENKKIVLCNKAFENIFDIESSEVVGMDSDDFNKLMKFSNENVFHKVECNGKAYEVSIITPKSNKRILLLMLAHIYNVENEKIGFVCISTDITDMKNEQQKIQHQEKLAVIGQVGAGIVHETKNHLASIIGYSQLLSLKNKDAKLDAYISRIEMIANDMNTVVVKFLSIAKPLETIMDVVSINEIIESIQYLLESLSTVNVKININLGDFEKDIIADESQIKQVILNMVKNAIEAMTDADDPHIDITTRMSDSQREVQLVISDNGMGIQEKYLDKLGTPFFTTKDAGTGLGLNVCYRIIQEHGGNIDAKSQYGKGTTFVISLPCIDD